MDNVISIIIVNYCTCALLRDCLDSLRRNGLAEVETIVVDNGSSDESVAMVQRNFPEVRLITNRNNLGFARANNQAIRESSAKYILLLNSDTVVLPGALQAMVGFIDEHAGVGGVACRLRFADGRIQATARRSNSGTGVVWLLWRLSGFSHLLRSNSARQLLRRYLGFTFGSTLRAYFDSYEIDQSPAEMEMLSGACLLLRRQAVDQIGLLDENFFMYLEDLDYCMRLRKAGWKLYYLPGAEIIHLGGQSSGGRMRRYNVEAFRSIFYFHRKHYSAGKLLLARALVAAAFSIHWVRNFISATCRRDDMSRRNCSDIAQVLRLCFAPGAGERCAITPHSTQSDADHLHGLNESSPVNEHTKTTLTSAAS